MTIIQHHLKEEVVPGKRLGRHVEFDERSRAFSFAAAAPLRLQSVLWPRHGRAFDQGSVGSCTGNATAGAINTNPLHGARSGTARVLHEKDALAIYTNATVLDSIPGEYPAEDTGSSGLAAAKAAREMGLIGSYQHAFGIVQALQALMHGPVITGVSWYEGFDNPDPAGHVTVSGQARGGHEFEVRGLSLGHDSSGGDALVIAENSWGPTWGDGGVFRFTVADWTRLLDEQGDVTVLLP